MEKLIDFAKQFAREEERVEVIYTANVQEETVRKYKELAHTTSDKKLRKEFLQDAENMEKDIENDKIDNISGIHLRSKTTLSLYIPSLNYMGIVLDKSYADYPMASCGIVAHEFYERNRLGSEEERIRRTAFIKAAEDNAYLLETKLVTQPLLTALLITINNDSSEFMVNRRVEKNFPEEYFSLASLHLERKVPEIKELEGIYSTPDMRYVFYEFCNIMEINSLSFPVETDKRQTQSSIDKIHKLKEGCISCFSASHHPVFGLSAKIHENLKLIPDKENESSMYSYFNNLINKFDKFTEDVKKIETRKHRKILKKT